MPEVLRAKPSRFVLTNNRLPNFSLPTDRLSVFVWENSAHGRTGASYKRTGEGRVAAPIPRVSLDSLQFPVHAAFTPSGEPGGRLVKFISEKPDRADQVEDNANDSDRLGEKSVECGGLAWV